MHIIISPHQSRVALAQSAQTTQPHLKWKLKKSKDVLKDLPSNAPMNFFFAVVSEFKKIMIIIIKRGTCKRLKLLSWRNEVISCCLWGTAGVKTLVPDRCMRWLFPPRNQTASYTGTNWTPCEWNFKCEMASKNGHRTFRPARTCRRTWLMFNIQTTHACICTDVFPNHFLFYTASTTGKYTFIVTKL